MARAAGETTQRWNNGFYETQTLHLAIARLRHDVLGGGGRRGSEAGDIVQCRFPQETDDDDLKSGLAPAIAGLEKAAPPKADDMTSRSAARKKPKP